MEPKLRILLIDDDPNDRAVLRDLLAEAAPGLYLLDEALDYEEGRRRLALCEHDVVLLDDRLGAGSGLDLLSYAVENRCRMPILFLTDQRDGALDEEAIRAGAADFIPKDSLSADGLHRAIRHALDRQKNQDELRDLNVRLEQRVQDRMRELQFINERLLREIATREKVEADLRANEEHQRVLVEQVKDFAIFRLDIEGKPTTWNEGVCRVLGFEEDEFVGRHVTPDMFLPEDVRAGIPERELEYAAQHGAASNDRWMRRKDGAAFWASGMTTRLLDHAGKLIGYTKVLRDLTEKKLAEDAAMEASARLKAIVDTAVDGIITIDGHGMIESMNPAALKLFGYPSNEVVGKNVAVLMPKPDSGEPDAFLAEYYRTGEPKTIGPNREVAARRSDGSTFLAELAVSETRLDGRRVFTGIVRDVTERKLVEAEMHDADRRKNEFLATLAHELRNPLAPIRNGIYMLRVSQEQQNTEMFDSTLNMMDGQIRHMVRLIDDLMDLSRISRGKVQLRKDRIELAWAINDAVETSRPAIEERQHNLVVELPDQPIYLDADTVRVSQVLANLLNNAAKYTEPGGTIRLSARCEPEAKGMCDYAVLRVADNGIGIPPEQLPNIFELFVQVDRASKYAPGGLGIGLSLVRGLVELHGGTVEAHSEGSGKGSEFTVRLPALPLKPRTMASHTDEMPILQSIPCRILVVDDNRDSADSLAAVLNAAGHLTAVAYDGLKAAALSEEFQPEIALLDIGLPGLTGHELASEIRRQAAGRDCLLVAMTGWGQDEDRKKSMEAGFDAHLVKPVDLADVHALVHAWSAR
ncbi:MAG: PAS domain S-box protein [Gemmataceae bacterium]|nr:PAS domain S-box protein [Gemmataceae bacterium]